MSNAARVLGKQSDFELYSGKTQVAKQSFVQLYYDTGRGIFYDPKWVTGNGPEVLQTEQALALTLDLDLPVAETTRVVDALVKDIKAHGLGTGMVGVKYVLPALARFGHMDVALGIMTSTEYPSLGYMLENGEGTLWERYEGSQHAIHGSRNHIMLGSPGQFLYQTVAGISLPNDAFAWDTISIRPGIVANSAIGGVEATVGTVRGAVSVAWSILSPTSAMCGVAQEKDLVGGQLAIACPDSEVGGIDFASYGRPLGNCSGGFTSNRTCNAADSVSVVTTACLGKRSCVLYANNTQFGGTDPCPGIAKVLAVEWSCKAGAYVPFISIDVLVPHGSTATVLVPIPPEGNTNHGVRVTERNGVTNDTTVLFANGSYVPGCEGVQGAAFVAGQGVEVHVGGGAFSFTGALLLRP
jgi:hypothetical protein